MGKEFFVNPEEKRLRAGFRLLLQAGLMVALVAFLVLLLGLVARAMGDLPGDEISVKNLNRLRSGASPYQLPFFLARLLGVGLSLFMAMRWLDRRPFADLGFRLDRVWWRDFSFGFFLGGLLMSGIFLAEWWAGWLKIVAVCYAPNDDFWMQLLALLGVYLCVGVYEEMLSRGYQLRVLAEGISGARVRARLALLAAWVLTSLVFGLGHGANPNATLLSCLGVAAAGLLLGLPYVLNGQLALPIGLHIAWNFFQGGVYGFPVSGWYLKVRILTVSQSGPVLWTGGTFGPEAGLLGLLACLVGAVLILGWLRLTRGRKDVSLH